MEQQFKNLFSPLKVGKITLPNRIAFPSHETGFYDGTKAPSERQLQYLLTRAKGGCGMIVSGPHVAFPVTTTASPTEYQSDSIVPVLRKFTDAIHEYPTRIFAQLYHGGSEAPGRNCGGGSVWYASPVWRRNISAPALQSIAHEMDKDDIKRFVEENGKAAGRLKEAGFDGIELAAVTGILLSSFLSPAYNIRNDEYGGSLENRMRIIVETLAAIREAIGPDLVLGMRFPGDDFMDRAWWTENHGNTLDDTKEIAKRLEDTGYLDYISCTAGGYGAAHIPPMYYPLAPFAYMAAGLKEVVNLPVITTGRINDPVLAEEILRNHQADMVGMVRALIADPELPNKARQGRLEEIHRCIGCNEGCIGRTYPSLPVSCSLNYEAGREQMGPITAAETKKSVMVIGGGVAGLETARIAALRGHKVSLYEKEDVLAKELLIATKTPGREGWEDVRRYYTYQMTLLDVDIHLDVEVTLEMVLQGHWDAVVVATGASPFIPEFPGSKGESVTEMRQVLQDAVEVGDNVIVIDYENHLHGLTTADFLAQKGKRVRLLNESIHTGAMVDKHTLEILYARLSSQGVVITPVTAVKEIQGKTVVTYNTLTGTEGQIEEVDSVVFCTDGRANDALYRSLKGKVKELYQVGQCVSPRQLLDSVADGYRVGRAI